MSSLKFTTTMSIDVKSDSIIIGKIIYEHNKFIFQPTYPYGVYSAEQLTEITSKLNELNQQEEL